ncbi:MAG: hypothetical protein IPL87_00125 [Candidatus Moraniibacteriota bacterium]|nr:MAG: hypothetical protein IPL87_00125 [Candidatus Moranbacteria bacterium]
MLPESKITGVKDIEGPYKKVTIHDGQITFSFEVPDTYFVETRNSGEREMTEEELREFFATNYFGNIKENPELSGQYLDFNWEMLKNMKYEEMKKVFDEYINPGNFPGFPKASLSSLGGISYPTASSTQIDLFILPTINFRFTLKKTIGGRSAFISFGENTPDPYSKWMEVNIPLAKEKSLVLYKQHYVRPEERAQYTQDDLKKIESESFDHLLDSLRFE